MTEARESSAPGAIAALTIGVGIGLANRGVLRLAGRLGLGTPEDDLVFVSVWVLLALVGAFALARPLRNVRGLGFGAWSLVAAAATFVDLAVLGAITTPRGFRSLCERFGADASLAGTWHVDGAVALVAFALPALAAGALTYRAASQRVAAGGLVAVGFAAGAALYPVVLEHVAGEGGSVRCIAFGAAAIALGSFLGPRRAALVGVVPAAVCLLVPTTPIVVKRPWTRFPAEPFSIVETTSGQITHERRRGVERLFLDQRAITPSAEELKLETLCIEAAFALFREELEREVRSVLFIGQPTKERVELMRAAGAERVDWWAPWQRADTPDEWRTIEGATRVPSPSDAADADLVLSLPAGAALALGFEARVAHDAPSVLWWPTDRIPPRTDGRAVFASDGLERISAGVAHGLGSSDSPAAPTRGRWATLSMRADERSRDVYRRVARAMSEGAGAGPFERGLAALAESQRASSPFEDALARTELEADAVRDLFATESPDRFQRGVLVGVAETMRAQGEAPWVFEFASPHALREPDWIALQRVVAWAEAQELQYAAAAARIEAFATADGAPATLRRDRAEYLVRAKDPRGTEAVRDLLRDFPADPVLFKLLQEAR